MPILALLAAILFALPDPALAGGAPFGSGDYRMEHRPDLKFPGGKVHRSPYPMSQRSASVWLSDACFRTCTGKAGWRFEACRPAGGPEACRASLDAEDRACLHACRTRGGPLLNIAD
jgi:hypothetical protein